MIDAVRQFSKTRRPVYAECGGLMCLVWRIIMAQGTQEMAGLIPAVPGCWTGKRP